MIVIFTFVSLTGCEEQAVTTETPENIIFESDVVELDAANLEFIKDDEEFDARLVELNYRLYNPLNRTVSVDVDVFFYDEFDRELYSKLDYNINLLPKYPDPEIYPGGAGFDTVEFGGSNAKFVDHVKITAYEKQ